MTNEATSAVLCVRDLHGWYGDSHVLHAVSFDVRPGQLVTLLGRNGAGKSTTLKAMMGLLDKRRGSILFRGKETIAAQANQIARQGLAYCPEDRGIFATLSVEENLRLPPKIRDGGMGIEAIYRLFPNLKDRAKSVGTKLSGGEQQMLAIARILRTGADTLLLDEPTEGLAPVIVKQIGAVIRELKGLGYTILLVEQNIKFAAKVADQHYVLENGRVVEHIPHAAHADEVRGIANYLHA
ncbi:ABC transporter ATP-binding protein [Xanthobacter sp. VNH20]|uniref:ABC transporter ATP-binding protein n=1 Tax=Xanthobacter sp. VNH20 TaxID=3156616 RepID=UPI0032B3490B